MDLGSALTHQDVTSQHGLTVGALDAQALGLAVPAVARATGTLLCAKSCRFITNMAQTSFTAIWTFGFSQRMLSKPTHRVFIKLILFVIQEASGMA